MRARRERWRERLVTQAPEPGKGVRDGAKAARVRPGGASRRRRECGALRVVALEPPGGVVEGREGHFTGERHAVAVREDVRAELRVRAPRIEIAAVDGPGAGVEELRVRPYTLRVGDDGDVADARRHPGAGPLGELQAARPVEGERAIEELDLRRRPEAALTQHGGVLAAHPRWSEVLDRDQEEPRVAEVIVDQRHAPTPRRPDTRAGSPCRSWPSASSARDRRSRRGWRRAAGAPAPSPAAGSTQCLRIVP